MNREPMKRDIFVSLFFVFMLFIAACARDEAASVFKKGEKLRVSGAYAEAIKQYEKVVLHYEQSEHAPEALYRIGEIDYIYLGDYAGAADSFNRLIALYPVSVRCREAQKTLADIYMYKLNNRKQAIVEYQKAMLYYGDSEESERFLYEIASAYFDLKNFEQQRLELRQILKRFPGTKRKADIYFQIANSYYVEGKLDDAIKMFGEIIKDFSDSPLAVEATFQLAVCMEEKEDLKKAISLLEDIKGIYPSQAIVERRIERIKKRLRKRRR